MLGIWPNAHKKQSGGVVAFDPATLAPTGWFRAFGGVPWANTGSVAGGALSQASGALQPAVGPAVDTFTPAVGDGVDDYMTTFPGHAFIDYLPSAAGTLLVPFYALAAPAAAPDTYDDPPLVTDNNNAFSLGFSAGGVGIAFYDGSWKQQRVACASASWHLAMCRWDSSNVEVGVDGTFAAPTPAGALALAASAMFVMRSAISAAKYFNGRVMEVFTKDAKLSNTDVTNFYGGYLKARYPSAGFP